MKLGLGAFGDGGLPIVLDSEYNKIMRDVAKEYDVAVVDARSELNKRPRVFFDMVRFDGEGHEILGRLVADLLRKIDARVALSFGYGSAGHKSGVSLH